MNSSFILLILMTGCHFSCIFAEEDQHFYKKFKTGVVLVQESHLDSSETLRLTASDSSLSLESSDNRFREITILIRKKDRAVFFSDFNFDATWDLKEEYRLGPKDLDKDPISSQIYFNGVWVTVKKGIKNRGFIASNGEEYIFDIESGCWSVVKNTPP